MLNLTKRLSKNSNLLKPMAATKRQNMAQVVMRNFSLVQNELEQHDFSDKLNVSEL